MSDSDLRYVTVASTNIYLLPLAEGYLIVDTSDESKYGSAQLPRMWG